MFKVSTPLGRISLMPVIVCVVLIGGLFVFGKGKIDIPKLYQLVQGSGR
jgi:hypothetical protein